MRPAEVAAPKIFGFAEFLTALALYVVLYAIVDTRFRFRLAVAPVPLHELSYAVVIVVGFGTLVSELWLARGWPVPWVGITRSWLQVVLAAVFLAMFLVWLHYAFIRPPSFSRANAKRFALTLYEVLIKGDDAELPAIASELQRSAGALVTLSRRIVPRPPRVAGAVSDEPERREPNAADYAFDVLRLIANRRLVRHVVESSPATAIVLFATMTSERRYDVPVSTFARMLTAEAVRNKDSILYHEHGGAYSSGLIGELKPWTQAIYGDFRLVEHLSTHGGSPLDVSYQDTEAWDAAQWAAYHRCVVATISGAVDDRWSGGHSFAIQRALDRIAHSCSDLRKLDGVEEFYRADAYERLCGVVEFVRDVVQVIDECAVPPGAHLHSPREAADSSIYDRLADLMFEMVHAASTVHGPRWTAWQIHHNTVWDGFFGWGKESRTWKVLQFKLRRRLYDQVVELNRFPGLMSARILGLILSVAGLTEQRGPSRIDKAYRPLARAVRLWTKKNYMNLRKEYPEIADGVLIGSISFEPGWRRIVKTFAKYPGREAPSEYLDLN